MSDEAETEKLRLMLGTVLAAATELRCCARLVFTEKGTVDSVVVDADRLAHAAAVYDSAIYLAQLRMAGVTVRAH